MRMSINGALRNWRNQRLFLLLLIGCVLFLYLKDHHNEPQLPLTSIPAVLKEEAPSTTGNLDRNTSIQENPSLPSFYPGLDAFPWDNFLKAVQKGRKDAIAAFSSRLLLWLTPYQLLAPKTPINASCTPPPLRHPRCKNKNGNTPRLKARKVGILIQFGFEVDILEIYLNEVYDVVDKFFILESSHTYTYVFKKRQLWERASEQPRFAKFADKIVHFVLDDAEAALMQSLPQRKYLHYAAERFQERARWDKFLVWNEATKFFGEDDLLGFGDSDEIPARHVIQYLKYCDLPSDPVDVGSWFVLGKVYMTLKTDWPVKGHPFTYGDPTFWSLRTAQNRNVRFNGFQIPTRNRGNSSAFLIGGTHMSDYPYLPNTLAKRLTNTEQDLEFIEIVASYPYYRKTMSVPKLEDFYANSFTEYYELWDGKKFNLSEVPKKELKDMYLPWFYECNRQRYPALEGKHDSRLD